MNSWSPKLVYAAMRSRALCRDASRQDVRIALFYEHYIRPDEATTSRVAKTQVALFLGSLRLGRKQ